MNIEIRTAPGPVYSVYVGGVFHGSYMRLVEAEQAAAQLSGDEPATENTEEDNHQ
jgi:hypothetical protein